MRGGEERVKSVGPCVVMDSGSKGGLERERGGRGERAGPLDVIVLFQ